MAAAVQTLNACNEIHHGSGNQPCNQPIDVPCTCCMWNPLPAASAASSVQIAAEQGCGQAAEQCCRELQEAAAGSTFVATMSSQQEVDEWRSKPKTMGGVNQHVYWGYPNNPAEVTLPYRPSSEWAHALLHNSVPSPGK